MIKGITFDKQSVSPQADGSVFNSIFADGVLWGCALSFDGLIVTIGAGAFALHGRIFIVDGDTAITVSNPPANCFARLKYKIDLTVVSSAASFTQGELLCETAGSADGFIALTQDDINASGTIYEGFIGIWQIVSGTISSQHSAWTSCNLKAIVSGSSGASHIGAAAIQTGGATNVQGILGELLPKSGGTMTGAVTARSITPAVDNAYGLGTSNMNWSNIFAKNLTIAGDAIIFNTCPWATESYSLGASNKYWNTLYARNITGHTLTGTLNARHILPTANVSWNLGSAALRWNAIYGTALNVTGDITLGDDLSFNTGANIRTASGKIYLHCSSNLSFGVVHGYISSTWQFSPVVDNAINLGTSGLRWKQLFAGTSTISTSDRSEKNSIAPLDEKKTIEFIMRHTPVSYKFNNGDSGRTHYGLVAQDVEHIMKTLKMSSLDFAGFIKSPKTDAEGNVKKGKFSYGLRYEEYIAPLITVCQNLLTRVTALEKEGA